MISVNLLADSTPLIGDAEALRRRYEDEGVLYLRGVMDPELIGWAHHKYRGALADEGLIDLANDAPVWTGRKTDTWRPCDALGTSVWHEVVKQPALNANGMPLPPKPRVSKARSEQADSPAATKEKE